MPGKARRLNQLVCVWFSVLCLPSSLTAQTHGVPPRVRVSEKVSQQLIIKKVNPDYPEEARKQHIQGKVVLRAGMSVKGDVTAVVLVSGAALLAPAAINAVKQWKYKPYLLNDVPIAVETQVTVEFLLDAK